MQWFGFSVDEVNRAARMTKHFAPPRFVDFPLLWDDLQMRKGECRAYMEEKCSFEWRWSSCTYCPFHSDRQWKELRTFDPEGWQQCVELDHQLRKPGVVVNRDMDCEMFLHKSCVPLGDVDLDAQQEMFEMICEYGCHT